MFKWIRIIGFLLVSLVLTVALPVNAQRLCEDLVDKALEKAGENCGGLEGDQACYGYDNLAPTFFEEVEDDVLTVEGSTIELSPVHTIESTGFDAEEDEWGIGYLQIGDGDSDEFEEGEFVRVIMMGDVTIENQIEPDADGFIAFEEIIMTAGEESDCQEAVNDMVIQAPQGSQIQMVINGIPVVMGSTVVYGWGEAEGTEFMYVTVLDGRAYPNDSDDLEIGLRQGRIVLFEGDEEQILDPVTGEPVMDENGEPMMRRYVGAEWSDPYTLVEEDGGFWTLGYYETFEKIPESLLNYPIDLQAEDEPCECELDDVVDECSIETGGLVTVTFENNSDEPFDVYWTNFECETEYYGTLNPGESIEQDTVIGHDWAFSQYGEWVSNFTIAGSGTYSYP